MIDVFFQTLPFFAIVGLGWGAGQTGFFSAAATAHLTKFVFYFALSAMLFHFTATVELSELLDWTYMAAYLAASTVVYLIGTAVALARRRPLADAAFEAQCTIIGNVGFLGLPMLAMLLGPHATGGVILVLAVDLIVFGSLIVILISIAKGGASGIRIVGAVVRGLATNPMIVSIVAGFAWSGAGFPMPRPLESFLTLLGAAATPGALFAIGASLAGRQAARLPVALWLSIGKLILHPAAVALAALAIFPVDRQAASVMIAAAALPVAGNVYILAQHYNVAPQRASAAILVSTVLSVVTVSVVIAWVATF